MPNVAIKQPKNGSVKLLMDYGGVDRLNFLPRLLTIQDAKVQRNNKEAK
eukprot:CAMPEP_0197651254 /NCGR_PEP_ID=MMETSP1338-20131121/31692_1 /TAXON_ID=43686 ORGANISM="Pelagodinium beii, Strain RCC1491" /NCGR_SAMPLE_ID=MMETSP1338 /ASSEMBLY_ACC=CAM_ASM_000754 /LENGTH=48 /DNA_ID= /DNA_START= /DNA_END= /DNA_ORIENTATION=